MALRPFSTVPQDTRQWAEWCRQQFITPDPGSVSTASLIDGAVTNAKLRDSDALSVIGRSVNSIGVPDDIVAAVDGTLLRRSGLTIGFGTITASYVSNFTTAAQDAAGAALVDTATINFTYTPGSITADVLDDSITDAKLRNSAALSVIGRSANSTGDPADITAANDGEVLRRSGTALGFGTVATAGIANDAVTNAKLADMADSTIKGSAVGVGTASPTDLTSAQVLAILGLTGLVPVVGSYTPTLTIVANLDATTAPAWNYLRIGDLVIVGVRITLDATAAGVNTQLRATLPIASNLAANQDLTGVAVTAAVAGTCLAILPDTVNDAATFQMISTDTANRGYQGIFFYRILP